MGFTQKFKVSGSGYQALAAEIKNRFGLSFDGNAGQIERNGFKGGYTYDPDSEELIIQLDKTPWMIADSVIKNTISSTISKHGGQPA